MSSTRNDRRMARGGLAAAVLSILASCAHTTPAVDADGALAFESGVTAHLEHSTGSGLSYVATVPGGPAATGSELMPMVIFLHSLEERGRRLELLFDNPAGQGIGLAGVATSNGVFSFVTLSPLCPAGTFWFFQHRRVDLLIAEVVKRYPVDPDRVYLMGVSMGGMGVWSLAMAYPHRFAAAAPIAGGVYSPPMRRRYRRMADVPVWAFHARHDPSIPLAKNERAVSDLNAAGGTARITVIESDRHYIQEEVFASGGLFAWFLEQFRVGDRPPSSNTRWSDG